MKKRKIGLIATAVIAAMILVTPTVLATVAPELKMPYPGGEEWYITQAYNGITHHGIDQYALDFTLLECDAYDEPVLAVASGTVIEVDSGHVHGELNYGNKVVIDHGNGYTTLYGHLNQILVQENQKVAQGRKIGTVGNTGYCLGSKCDEYPGTHLHFRMLDGDEEAYKPEPMSGQENFATGQWCSSNNYGDSWYFNVSTYSEGWEAHNVEREESFVEDGKYFIDPEGSDPYIQIDGIFLNASEHNAFFINISSGCQDTEAMIRFNTTTSPEYGEDKEIPFYVHNDGTFNLFINFIEEDYPLWKGNITGIRIYPAKEGISGSDADIVGFESIEFIYVKPAPLMDTYVPDDYPTIQAAIDSAEEGDTIIVRPGTYTENVKVNKDYLTIKSESGAETTIVQATNLGKSVFEIKANYVNVSGFTVKSGRRGIFLYRGANHCNVSNNIAFDNRVGIRLYFSGGNTLINNIARDNEQGIAIMRSDGNILRNNLMSGNLYNFGLGCCDFDNDIDTTNTVDGKPIYYIRNAENQVYGESTNAGALYCINCDNVVVKDLELSKNGFGIFFWETENSKIENVTVLNSSYGIALAYSNNNILDRNNILDSYTGVYLGSSDNNILENNTISSSEGHGITLSLSTNNNLAKNTISNNYQGIMMVSLSGNILTRNSFSDNHYGIWMQYSNDNEIYLNDFTDNTDSICYYRSSSLDNIWNSPEKITYTYNGNTYENYLGNYWDDYTDIDANSDGIWDNPYSIDRDKDDYPLTELWEIYN